MHLSYRFLAIMLLLGGEAWGGLRLGEDVRVKYVYFDNADQDKLVDDSQSFFVQKTRLYLEGDAGAGVSAGLKLQSKGIWGTPPNSTGTVTVDGVTFASGTYPTAGQIYSHSPWIEHAYVRLLRPRDLPVEFIVGRQPLKYGDGLLLDDDGFGANAVRARGFLPFGFEVEALTVKRLETAGVQFTTVTFNNDQDLYSGLIRWSHGEAVVEGYGLWELDPTRAVELGDSKKTFFGIRLDVKKPLGLVYKIEAIRQGGHVDADNPAIKRIDYQGYALNGGFAFITPLHRFSGDYVLVTGETATLATVRREFRPPMPHRSSDPGSFYFGEFFNEVYPGLDFPSTSLAHAGGGREVFAVRYALTPVREAQLGVDYFALGPDVGPEFGDEFDIHAEWSPLSQVSVRTVLALFYPRGAKSGVSSTATVAPVAAGSAVTKTDFGTKFLVEVAAKF